MLFYDIIFLGQQVSKKMDKYDVSYYVGISIVFFSHIAVYKHMTRHAQVNLVAGALIALYFIHSKGLMSY